MVILAVEQLGKKVSQKSGLNRAILDQGWGEFRRHAAGWTATEHQSHLPVLRSRIKRQSANTSKILVRRLRLRKSRRCCWRDQCFRAGIPFVSLWRVGAVRALDEAGTHRSDSQIIAQRRRNPRPLGGEDVNQWLSVCVG